jgi:predicted RNA binding protein YcfA (HicA-like mRNA interferase family)
LATKVREAIRLVRADGWYQIRQRRSHRHFKHPTKRRTVTIAGRLGDTLPAGTWANIRRQAGI